MSKIVIRRASATWQDRARDYIVLVDGSQVARIGNKSEVEVGVEPGTHTLRLIIDWCGSAQVRFSVTSDDVVRFECAPNASPFLSLLYITLWRNDYIRLEQLNDTADQ